MLLSFDTYSIQPIQESDYWALCNFAVTNEDHLQRFFPLTLAQNLTPELSKIFAAKKVKNYTSRSEFLFTIKEEQTEGLVGLVYIKELDWEALQGEFAYCIGYEFEGKNIISRTVAQLSLFAFEELGLKTLQIISHKSNIGSIKVAEKNKYIWKKTLLKSFAPPGEEALDMELYELQSST